MRPSLAHVDLIEMRVALFGYAPFAERVWALRARCAFSTPKR